MPPYASRKRARASMSRYAKSSKRRKTGIAKFRAGRDRVAGYYGRYSGSSSSLSGGELKFFDTDIDFSLDQTGEVVATGQLNLIPQGVTESTRIGRKCRLTSLQLRAMWTYDPAASVSPSSPCFLYLVLDKQCNGAAAAVTDVLNGSAMNKALINMANSDRFTILKRWVWTPTAVAGVDGAYAPVRGTIDYYKKCDILLDFSSTTGALTEIKSNNLFLLGGSSAGDDVTTITGQVRLRYKD